jgi:hypothetical protein
VNKSLQHFDWSEIRIGQNPVFLIGSMRLVIFDELPERLKKNKFILDGYRIDYNTVDSLKSLFHLHNETMNIWTHILGFLLFLPFIASLVYMYCGKTIVPSALEIVS